jgi:hypothetical protein
LLIVDGARGIVALDDPHKALELGDFYHVGIAVHDIDRGIERLSALSTKAGPVFELLVPSVYRGKTTEAGVKAVFAPLGGIAIELVEPTSGESSIATFLRDQVRASSTSGIESMT